MDSLTHIALGACIGEAFFEKGFGKKAMFWGALSQSIPDIDFLAAAWCSPAENLLAHRGFTHSILFALLAIPLFSMIAEKIHRPHNISFRKWTLFFAAEICLHLVLDINNNYGIGLLEPFSHARYALNSIYIADPLFSAWPGIAFVMLLILNRHSEKRKSWWRFGVIIPFLYLGFCIMNKIRIDRDVKEIFSSQHIVYNKYFTTPAPLQNMLWFVVAGNDTGYWIGYRSIFDRKKEMSFRYFSSNDSLLKPVADHEDLQKLTRFSQGFYTLEKWHDTLVFNDLRFGQIVGWKDPNEHFVFHYYLHHGADNKLVVQRGRFAKWDWEAVSALFKRIGGN